MENDGLFAFELNEAEGYWNVTRYYGKGEDAIFPVSYKGKPVKKVGDDKFSIFKKRIKTIKRVIIPEGYTSIGERAFYACEELTSIKLPKGITSIGEQAFCGCEKLTSIKLPVGLTSIGEGAFFECLRLIEIKFPETLASIGKMAFCSCIWLIRIKLPESLTSIGEGAFGCTGLAEITVDENNPVFCSLDGVMFDKAMTTLRLFPQGKKGMYSIPDGIITIETGAFCDCKLTGISFPQSLLYIKSFGFNGEQLTDITVNESNPNYCSIDGVLFDKEKKSLLEYPKNKDKTDYTVPDGIIRIESRKFCECKNLVNIVLPESLEFIDDFAFARCERLKAITFPMSIQYIGERLFESCSNLETITLSRKTRIGIRLLRGFKGQFVYRD